MPALFQHRLVPLHDMFADYGAHGADPFEWDLAGWYSLSFGSYWLCTKVGVVPAVHPLFAQQHRLTGEATAHVDYQVARC